MHPNLGESMILQPRRPFIVTFQGTTEWVFAHDQDSGEWLGVCADLNLNASGDTFAELHQCVGEAMQLLFLDLFRDGELETFLRRLGWTVTDPLPEPDSSPRFDVPYTHRLTKVREMVPA